MANDLKKVGLVFKADGSVNFTKTLKQVNTQLKLNYQELKLTQSQYDKNTSSAERLADEQKYLTEAIGLQKEKIRQCKEALEQLNTAEVKNENAIAQAKIQVASAETSLARYEKQLNKVNLKLETSSYKFDDFSKKAKDAGYKLDSYGKTISKASAVASAGLVGVTKKAIDFESAFTGVTKTVDGTDKQLYKIKQGLLELAEVTSSSSIEIAGVAETAGQLGVKTENILDFTEAMIRLGDSTNLSAEEAATSIAQLYNVMGSDINTVDNFGSALVTLGNNAATTESDILNMATRIASSGHQVGLTEQEVLALATTLSSVGLEAEGGGSSISAVISKIDKDVATSSNTLKTWADISDLSIKEFKKLWETDAMSAIQKVISGMGNASAGGQNLNVILSDLGVSSLRQTDTMKRLSNASELMSEMVSLSNDSWNKNISLTEESNKKYETTQAKIQQMLNTLTELAVKLGEVLLPIIKDITEKISGFLNWLSDLNPETQKIILKIVALVAAIGPILILIGKITQGVSGLIKVVKLLSIIINANPIGLIIIAITALITIIVLLVKHIKKLWDTNDEFRNSVLNAWNNIVDKFNAINDFFKNIFSTDFTKTFGILGEPINAFLLSISQLYDSFKQILSGITDFIKGVFTGDWELAWTGIKKIFLGVFDGLLAIAKRPLNGIIGFLNMLIAGINVLIRGINKIKIKTPDWIPGIGGKELGFNIGQLGKIPYLAKGGTLLNGAAIVAESGPEMLLQEGNKTRVIPLNSKSKNTNVKPNQENNFNVTINSNSKYLNEAEAARQARKELQALALRLRRG